MIADAAFAFVLALAAMLSVLAVRPARAASRAYLHLAAALYVAFAVADEIAIFLPGAAPFAQAVALVICALGPVLLALALFATFEHPPTSWIAAAMLLLALSAGLYAALSGAAMFSFAPLSASGFVMLALSARRWRLEKRGPLHAILAALCFLAGAAAGAHGTAGCTALALFSAAGLLGLSLALARRSHTPVEEQRGRDLRFIPVGTER